MVQKSKPAYLEKISKQIVTSVQQSLSERSSVAFSKDPETAVADIIEFDSRMRLFGLEKFNGPCYLSCVQYYTSQEAKTNKDAAGAIVVYFNSLFASRLLKTLGYREFNESDEETVIQSCSEFASVIAQNFSSQLRGLGYPNLVVSDPIKAKNDIPEGIEFDYSQNSYAKASFYIWKEKILAVDVTLPSV